MEQIDTGIPLKSQLISNELIETIKQIDSILNHIVLICSVTNS